MAKLTKLTIVQRVLSLIDSEVVDQIGDTVESEQVAMIVDSVYDELFRQYDWPFLRRAVELESTATLHIMRIPEDIYGLDWLRYRDRRLEFITLEEMFELLSRQSTQDNSDENGALNDQDPVCYTLVDDEYIWFNAYDESLEPRLIRAFGIVIPPRMDSDLDTPRIPTRFHTVLMNGVTSQALYTLKGDDSLGDRYQRLYNRGIIEMKRWAQGVDRPQLTNTEIDFGRNTFRYGRYFPTW